jgi:predicted nuclease of predicted toxin-antitoxin system
VRLLFDEQLSEALVQRVADEFPGALHVRVLRRGGALDLDVWEMAREHGCVLVTKDEDFHRLSLLRGAPPKVVWLRIGNCATEDISRLLRMHADHIRQFEAQASATVLELG